MKDKLFNSSGMKNEFFFFLNLWIRNKFLVKFRGQNSILTYDEYGR